MDRDTFVSVFGSVFEETAWAAEQAWKRMPFETNEALVDTMCQVIRDAGSEEQLTLLCAHPELGSNKKMTDASEQEQLGAGIRKNKEERAKTLKKMNDEYRKKFGFPFIVAVKGLSMEMILENMQNRLHNDHETEFNECLAQVFKIAQIRLGDILIKE